MPNRESLQIRIDPPLEKSREKLLSRRCRRHARKLGYPFQPRNWSNGIHLFNRANSIGATPESLERPEEEEECKMCGVSRGKNSLRAAFLFSPFALSPFGEMAPQSTLFGDANCHRETDRGRRISSQIRFGVELFDCQKRDNFIESSGFESSCCPAAAMLDSPCLASGMST